eukprot:2369691-Pyramimonas_sp.AAC.1
MLKEHIRRRHRSSEEMTTRGRDGNAIVDALVAADENMANYDRHALVDTSALNDPTRARRIGHRLDILRSSAE